MEINNTIFRNLSRGWLTGILLFLPFQESIIRYILKSRLGFIKYLDEITVAIFLLPAIARLYNKKEIFDKVYLFLLLPIFCFSVVGLISGTVSGNSLLVTVLGTYWTFSIFGSNSSLLIWNEFERYPNHIYVFCTIWDRIRVQGTTQPD